MTETVENDFYCSGYGEETKYEALKCPYCGAVQQHKLERMLSENPLVPFLDFIDSMFVGFGVLLLSWEVWPGRENMALWAPFAALLTGMAVYYLFCYSVFRQTLMEAMFGVVVIDGNCRANRPLEGPCQGFYFHPDVSCYQDNVCIPSAHTRERLARQVLWNIPG